MTEKQFQAILSPIYRFEALSEDTVDKLTGIEMLTVDANSLQKETVDQLNQQTVLLGEIKTIMRDQVNLTNGSNSSILNSVNTLSLDLKSSHTEHMEEMRNQSTLLKLVVGSLVKANRNRTNGSPSSGDDDKSMAGATGFKPLSVKDTGLAAFMMVSLSAAVVASAGIFSLIPKVSGSQLLTAVAIVGTIALMTPGFISIMKSMKELNGETSVSYKGIDAKKTDVSTMFATAGATLLAMVGMIAAIVVSSFLMRLIVPISPMQLLTAVLIGAALLTMAPTFVKIANTLGKMKGQDKIDAGALGNVSSSSNGGIWALMGATLISIVGLAAGIAVSSWIFQLVMPVAPIKLLTAFLVGIALTGAAWAYSMVLDKIEGKNIKDILKAGLAIPIIAGGIAVSSWILQAVAPITDLKVYATVFLIGLSLVASAYSFKLILDAIKGAKQSEILYAGAAMAIIAGAVWLVAWIFTQLPDINKMKAPDWRWSLKAGLSLLVFSLSFIGLVKGVKGASLKDMGKAAAAAVFVALGIVGTAYIFDIYENLGGKYGAPPEAAWTLKAGLALIVFGASIAIIGMLVNRVTFKSFVVGVLGAIVVSLGILGVAWILSALPKDFTTIPTEWSLGIIIALVLFSVPIAIIGAIAASGAGAVAILLGVVGVILIAGTIWVVAKIFSNMPDLTSVSKSLSEALLTPVNGIVDILARLKNEIGVDNLLPLAGGIIAISVSLLALAGATAGVAAGGLFSSIANVGKAFFDGITSFFGGEKSKGPLDILEDIIRMAPQLQKVAKPIQILGDAFSFLQGGQNMEVLNRFFELMQLDPKMSNVEAIQGIAPHLTEMVNSLTRLPAEAPQRLKELFGGVKWNSINKPMSEVANSMELLAKSATLAGSGVMLTSKGMSIMVDALNRLKKEHIDSVIKLFNEVDWQILIEPVKSISNSISKMSINADKLGVGMSMAADALILMSTIPVDILKEIAAVFDSLAKSDLESQGNAMLFNIAPAMASISATMLVMRSDAYIRMFEVMASSSEAIVAMSKPMTQIASAMDKMGKVNIDGIEWAHKMARQLARSSFNSQATALEKMAKSYADISKSSNSMNVEAINSTTDMFKALAYLYQNGRKNAIEELGEKLTDAVQELARMIADFEGTVNEQAEGSKTVGQAMAKAVDNFSDKIIGSSNTSSKDSSNQTLSPESLQELIDMFTTGNAYITIRDVEDAAAAKIS